MRFPAWIKYRLDVLEQEKRHDFVLLLSGRPPFSWQQVSVVLICCPTFLACSLQISLDTKDVFIECTATDLTKAKTVLNTVVCMFAEYCSTPFEVEPVQVVDAAGAITGEAFTHRYTERTELH